MLDRLALKVVFHRVNSIYYKYYKYFQIV